MGGRHPDTSRQLPTDDRQAVLTREPDPLRLSVVIDESVLYHVLFQHLQAVALPAADSNERIRTVAKERTAHG